MRALVASLVTAVLYLSGTAADNPLGAVWVGGTDVMGSYNLVEIDLRPTANAPHGTVEVRSSNSGPIALTDCTVAGAELRFEIPTPRGVMRFTGKWENDRLTGELRDQAGQPKKVHAFRTAAVSASAHDMLVGSYTLGDTVLEVTYASKGQLSAIIFSQREGKEVITRNFRLLPTSDHEFLVSGSVLGSLKMNDTIVFTPPTGGKATLLTWRNADGKTVTASRTESLRQERVSFDGPVGHINGLLVKPAGAGPFPAFVQVHGSGPTTIDNIYLRARAYAQLGVATLLFDKRGTGDTAGDFRQAKFADFGADAAAAWRFLRTRPDVDQARLGFQAQSEGGWVLPFALAAGAEPAFVIMTSAGPIHPMEQEIYRAEAQTLRNGLSADAAKAAVAFMKLKWETGFGRSPWPVYAEAMKKVSAEKWYASVQGATVPEAAEWAFIRDQANFDPTESMRQITAPTLVITSSADPLVPGERVAKLWEELWQQKRPPGSQAIVLPGLDHGLLIRNDRAKNLVFIEPAAPQAIAAWMKQNGFLR